MNGRYAELRKKNRIQLTTNFCFLWCFARYLLVWLWKLYSIQNSTNLFNVKSSVFLMDIYLYAHNNVCLFFRFVIDVCYFRSKFTFRLLKQILSYMFCCCLFLDCICSLVGSSSGADCSSLFASCRAMPPKKITLHQILPKAEHIKRSQIIRAHDCEKNFLFDERIIQTENVQQRNVQVYKKKCIVEVDEAKSIGSTEKKNTHIFCYVQQCWFCNLLRNSQCIRKKNRFHEEKKNNRKHIEKKISRCLLFFSISIDFLLFIHIYHGKIE